MLFSKQAVQRLFFSWPIYLVQFLYFTLSYNSSLCLILQLPFLCGLPFLERRASQTAHFIVGRTGKHLFLTDNDGGKPPLLVQMVNDSDDLKFMLVQFSCCNVLLLIQ